MLIAEGQLGAQPAGGFAFDHFRAFVDVDGDGASGPSDRAIFQWWLDSGGNILDAMAAAPFEDGVYDIAQFLSSVSGRVSDLMVPTGLSDPAPLGGAVELPVDSAQGVASGEEESQGGEPLGGGSATLYCQYEPRGTLEEIPAGAFVIDVPAPGSITDIQTAFDTAKGLSLPLVMVRVPPGTYSGQQLFLDVTGMSNEVILASHAGPVFKQPWTGPPAQNGTTLNFGVTPALYGIRIWGTPGAGAVLHIGWTRSLDGAPTAPDYSGLDAFDRGWRGFEIVGDCGGIRVESPILVKIRGNFLHCSPPLSGTSGIRADGLQDLEIFHNEVSGYWNSGIELLYTISSEFVTKIIGNYIHGNEAMAGGGIRAEGQNIELCSNSIYDNTSITIAAGGGGGGVSYRFLPDLTYERRFYAHGNRIDANRARIEGGGMRLSGSFVMVKGGALPAPWNFALIANQFRDNGLNLPPTRAVDFGGGLFMSVDLPAGSDGLFAATPGQEGQLVIGNTFLGNLANAQGGGAVIFATDTGILVPYSIRFEHDTLARNRLTAEIPIPLFPVEGSGLRLYDQYGYVTGNGVIIQENEPFPTLPGLIDYNWNASGGPNLFSYSRMPDCSPNPSTGDLLGDSATNPTSNTDLAFLDAAGHQHVNSISTREQADPILEILYLFSSSALDEDFDRDPRVDGPGMDIGADEYYLPRFRRGDANGDTMVNIADVIRMLDAMFLPGSPPPQCELACDTNDDELWNLSDAIFLLNVLFSAPPPPMAPPYPGCGIDPTLNFQLPCLVTPCP